LESRIHGRIIPRHIDISEPAGFYPSWRRRDVIEDYVDLVRRPPRIANFVSGSEVRPVFSSDLDLNLLKK
jgi:hypothetical protein